MRAIKVLEALQDQLDAQDRLIWELLDRNSRLTASLLQAAGQPAAAAAVRPRPPADPEAAPAARPHGL